MIWASLSLTATCRVKRKVGGISQQMLTRTIKTLECDSMFERTVRHNTSPQVGYPANFA
ncbi:winged helix-turn-helix transcriptional regulator [Agrobacterium sp. rho-13.3]|uniref:winged helix-turn-helix transcriptional regulator n=1 Tax=Agrobacterium sp. rho-13.3 TaxID=3072980 RepID=UPI003D7925FB